jgi:putative hydroxymethylpyrimidine transport system substrate-binding protein
LRPAAFDAGRYQRFQSFLIESGLLSEAMPIDKIAIDVTAK